MLVRCGNELGRTAGGLGLLELPGGAPFVGLGGLETNAGGDGATGFGAAEGELLATALGAGGRFDAVGLSGGVGSGGSLGGSDATRRGGVST